MHGRDPRPIISHARKHDGIEKLVCLGDYDSPYVLEKILNLKIPKIVLIGNHDYHLVLEYPKPKEDRVYISSSHLPYYESQAYEKLLEEWQAHKKAKRFVEECSKVKCGRKKGIKVVERIDGERIAYIHAALTKDPPEKGMPPNLWRRIIDENLTVRSYRVSSMFSEMKENDYFITFRGHDHTYAVFSIPRMLDPLKFQFSLDLSERINLSKNKRYIVSVNSCSNFNKNQYLIFDTSKLELEMKSY